MDFDTYQELSKQTSRSFSPYALSHELSVAIAAMGMAGEVGEAVDYLKKVIGHGHPLDKDKLKSELGDILYYLAEVASLHGISLSSIARGNRTKLQFRYPNGFSPEASINRKPEDV